MNALHVAYKDALLLLKAKGQLVMLFLVPIGFVLAFSAAYAAGTAMEEEAIALPVVDLDGGTMAELLVDNLNDGKGIETEAYEAGVAAADLKDETIKMALTIPAGFTDDVAAGTRTEVALAYGPAASSSELQAVQVVVEGVAADLSLETQLVDGLSQMGAMMSDAPEDVQVFTAERVRKQAESQFTRSKETPLVSLASRWPDTITQGRAGFEPETFGVAGFAIMFAFLGSQVTAKSIFDEKSEGTFRRLLAAPMEKWELLLGKMLPNFALAIVQMVVIVAASAVLLPLTGQPAPVLAGSPVGLLLLTVLVALCSTSLGVLLAAICRTESQVGGVSTLFLWIAGMVGGAFIPTFILGDVLSTVGKVVPHYWALQAYTDLTLRGLGVVDILPQLAVLTGFTALFFGIGLWRFRFD